MVWRSRFAGLTEMDRITVVLGPVLAWAWADCLATSVVPPCRTHRNVVEKLLACCTVISSRLITRSVLHTLNCRANQPFNI